jgi:glycosyltransferase involved in cell wall biosynthesis
MDRGGAEKQVVLLATHLPAEEFEVRVYLLTHDGPRSADLRAAGIPTIVIGKRWKADPTALLRLRNELREFRPDVVHTWLFAANSFGRVASLWAGVPRIIASERSVDPWKGTYHGVIDRWLAKRSECITTNSTGVRDFYSSRGIDPGLFRIIPNGIEPRTTVSVSRAEIFSRLEVEPDRKLLIAVGRLWHQKRYRDLIWAGELLATVRNDTTLVIVGDGPLRGELPRFRDSVSTPRHVRFVGIRDDVPELLAAADLFWIGSEYEGQSNALIEAMQAGVPVVASDIPGNRDFVTHDVTGRLVSVGDSAGFARQSRDLLDHPETARRLAHAAQNRIATEFTVEAMVQAHARLYRQER